MILMDILILGCGFTGERVALRFVQRGATVAAVTRNPEAKRSLADAGVRVTTVESLPPVASGTRVLYSIPTLIPEILEVLTGRVARMVYLSTTGVYKNTRDVNENTPTGEHIRLEAERAIAAGPWPALILRPAAIYGPGRGIQVSMSRGEFRLVGDGSNFVSRIHVDDLAAHCEAALLSDITGAYPVADEEPCSSHEIAAFCAKLLGVPMPPSVSADEVHDTRRADRRVDGSAIRKLLGINLKYPSYKVGIPASLEHIK
jgi:nucleoside-diphosphate-sugar epimerase